MRIRRSLVLFIAMCLAAATLLTTAPPSGADHGGPFHDGDTALLYADILSGDGAAGSTWTAGSTSTTATLASPRSAGFCSTHPDCPLGRPTV